MIKLIAMDLDGTLFDNDHKTISQANVDAVRRASAAGIKIAVASGRTLCHITEVTERLSAVDYVVCSNGSSVMDINGSTIVSNCMDFDTWRTVYSIFDDMGIITEVYCEGRSYLKECGDAIYTNKALTKKFIDDFKKQITFCDDIFDTLKNKPAEKLAALYVDDSIYADLKKKFEDMNLYVTSSIPSNMEVGRAGANKGAALSALCGVLGITADEVMTFGDGTNDIEMLEFAGTSFAMKNADDDVKRHAKGIADYNYNNGVAEQINKILM